MEDDELLFEIKDSMRRSRTTFESVINRKRLSEEDMEAMFNHFQ